MLLEQSNCSILSWSYFPYRNDSGRDLSTSKWLNQSHLDQLTGFLESLTAVPINHLLSLRYKLKLIIYSYQSEPTSFATQFVLRRWFQHRCQSSHQVLGWSRTQYGNRIKSQGSLPLWNSLRKQSSRPNRCQLRPRLHHRKS